MIGLIDSDRLEGFEKKGNGPVGPGSVGYFAWYRSSSWQSSYFLVFGNSFSFAPSPLILWYAIVASACIKADHMNACGTSSAERHVTNTFCSFFFFQKPKPNATARSHVSLNMNRDWIADLVYISPTCGVNPFFSTSCHLPNSSPRGLPVQHVDVAKYDAQSPPPTRLSVSSV